MTHYILSQRNKSVGFITHSAPLSKTPHDAIFRRKRDGIHHHLDLEEDDNNNNKNYSSKIEYILMYLCRVGLLLLFMVREGLLL
jgi:hypothetical protein